MRRALALGLAALAAACAAPPPVTDVNPAIRDELARTGERKPSEPTESLERALLPPVHLGMPEERREEYEAKRYDGYHALNVMEQQLVRTPYLVGDHYSIADVALYAYTRVAEEGGFELEGYPAIRAWLERVASHPRHVGMFD